MKFAQKASATVAIVLAVTFGSISCSMPSLESPACTESKNAVREFYSYHFGHEMKFSEEGLKAREKYLTPEFSAQLAGTTEGIDPFTTGSDNLPKAFRVGSCREISTEQTESSVLLFWHGDDGAEQREIKVETIDINDSWLVNKISR